MNNILEFEQNGVKYLAVEVDKGATDFSIESPSYLCYFISTIDVHWDINVPQLANGFSWECLFTTESATAEQCAVLVPLMRDSGYPFEFQDRKETLLDFIVSLGGSDDKNYVILKQI
jgi:hypothetical protein